MKLRLTTKKSALCLARRFQVVDLLFSNETLAISAQQSISAWRAELNTIVETRIL